MGTSFVGLSIGNFRLGVGAINGAPGVFIGESFWAKGDDYDDGYSLGDGLGPGGIRISGDGGPVSWWEIQRQNIEWWFKTQAYNKNKKRYGDIIPLSAEDFDKVRIGDTIWGLPYVDGLGPSWGKHIVLDKKWSEDFNRWLLRIGDSWFANAWFGRKP